MTTNTLENTTILSNFESDLDKIVAELLIDFEQFEQKNIILDISNLKILKPKDLNVFAIITKHVKKSKKSFVIVINDIDFNKISDKINVVPTLQEAHDIIEMEEIERDLGI